MTDFKGFAYPIAKSPHGYFRNADTSVEQIKSDLIVLLLTNPGERVMLNDFGTPLRDLFFDPNDTALAERAKQMIATSIQMWEPRVGVDQIEVGVQQDSLDPNQDMNDEGHILMIRISFREFDNIQEVQELRLAVPLEGKSF